MSVCAETTHFEDEQRQRCVLDADDHALVDKKVAMHPHPLEDKRKAADQKSPSDESMYITDFGWKIRDDVPVPAVAERDPAPPQLSDVINCQCKAVGKKCSTEACGCRREHLSCTNYCNCRGHDGCCNPHTTQGVMQAVDDDNAKMADAGDEIVDRDEDVVVVADGEDEHADSNNLDDEWE